MNDLCEYRSRFIGLVFVFLGPSAHGVQVPPTYFSRDPSARQYVYLQAQFPNNVVVEKVVMVSFQAGYIFIQTDKTLYTPESTGESGNILCCVRSIDNVENVIW